MAPESPPRNAESTVGVSARDKIENAEVGSPRAAAAVFGVDNADVKLSVVEREERAAGTDDTGPASVGGGGGRGDSAPAMSGSKQGAESSGAGGTKLSGRERGADEMRAGHGEDVHITPAVVRVTQAIAWNCVGMFVAECIIEVLLLLKLLPKIPFRIDFFFLTTLSAVLAVQSLRGVSEGNVDVTRNSLVVAFCVEAFLIVGDTVFMLKEQEKYWAVIPIRAPFGVLTGLNVIGVVWLYTHLHLWRRMECDATDAGHWVPAAADGDDGRPPLRTILTRTPSSVVAGLKRRSILGRLRRAASAFNPAWMSSSADQAPEAEPGCFSFSLDFGRPKPTFSTHSGLQARENIQSPDFLPDGLPQWTSGYDRVQTHAMSLSVEERVEFIKMLKRMQNIEDMETLLASGGTPETSLASKPTTATRPGLKDIGWGAGDGDDIEAGKP